MNKNIKIFPMTSDDLNKIKDELIKNFDEFWSYGILEAEIANINSKYIIAKHCNEIVGFAGYTKIFDEANIMNIVTRKDKRNQGIASCLLENLILIAKDDLMSSITLEVNKNNLTAIHIYKKFNFKETGLRKKYYDNKDDALIMTLYLK